MSDPARNDLKALLFNHEVKNAMILHWLSAQNEDTILSIRMFYANSLNCPLREIPTEFWDNHSLDFVWMIFSSKIKTFHNKAEKRRKKNNPNKKTRQNG